MEKVATRPCETDSMTRPSLFVTLEGYAVEGGFDRAGEPATCYSPMIALGRLAGPGAADDLWRRYESVLDLVPTLGFVGVRLTLEWARLEPRQGVFDDTALRRYVEVVSYARALGLGVTVALVDAAWPSWLGLEAWLLPWVVPHVQSHARRVAAALPSDVRVVVFTQPKELVTGGYLTGTLPPWRRSALRDAGFADAQVGRLIESLRADDLVGPRIVERTLTTTLDVSGEELVALRESADVEEIYVRSLVRGSGPTATDRGLLAQHGDTWSVNAPDELRDALR